MTIANFASGEVEITDGEGGKTRLDRETANRLIMAARMHTVSEFVEKLPGLMDGPHLAALRLAFDTAATSTDRWNLKEKFARLQTLTRGYHPDSSQASQTVVETVTL